VVPSTPRRMMWRAVEAPWGVLQRFLHGSKLLCQPTNGRGFKKTVGHSIRSKSQQCRHTCLFGTGDSCFVYCAFAVKVLQINTQAHVTWKNHTSTRGLEEPHKHTWLGRTTQALVAWKNHTSTRGLEASHKHTWLGIN